MRSRWSVAFSKMSGSLRDWSDRTGHSVQSISAWRCGDRRPNDAVLQKIEDMGGPPKDWIDEPIAPPGIRQLTKASPPPAEATSDDTASEAAKLLGHIRDLEGALRDPEQIGEMDLPQRIRCTTQLAQTIVSLGAITGIKLTERMILSSPLWGALLERILAALTPWPDALRAVAKTLEASEKDPKA